MRHHTLILIALLAIAALLAGFTIDATGANLGGF